MKIRQLEEVTRVLSIIIPLSVVPEGKYWNQSGASVFLSFHRACRHFIMFYMNIKYIGIQDIFLYTYRINELRLKQV